MQFVEVNQIINNEPEEIIHDNNIRYTKSLFGQFEFDLYDDCLKPDCTFFFNDRKYYVYFNLKSLSNKLEVDIANLFKKYPKNLENLKEPLEKYMKEYQKEEYKENISLISYIMERTKFIFGDEPYNRKVQERAIKMAFLYSQLKSETIRINEFNKKITIGIIESYTYKIKIFSLGDFQNIKDEINNIDIRINNINEIYSSLELIKNKMQTLINEVINKELDAINQKITILYILKQIDDKLCKIEDSNDALSDSFQLMINIRSQINRYIKENIKKEQKNFFFDFGLCFKIIKNTKNKKQVFLDGINIYTFFDAISQNFENLKNNLFNFNANELQNFEINSEIEKNIFQFLSNKIYSFLNFDQLENAINNLNINGPERIINAYKEKIKLIFKNNNNDFIKLIKEWELINKFIKVRRLVRDESKINGYLVSKKIDDSNNPQLDLYSVDIIY